MTCGLSGLGGDHGTRGALLMTGVPPPQAPSGWVMARSGQGVGLGGEGVLKELRKFWRGIKKSSGI